MNAGVPKGVPQAAVLIDDVDVEVIGLLDLDKHLGGQKGLSVWRPEVNHSATKCTYMPLKPLLVLGGIEGARPEGNRDVLAEGSGREGFLEDEVRVVGRRRRAAAVVRCCHDLKSAEGMLFHATNAAQRLIEFFCMVGVELVEAAGCEEQCGRWKGVSVALVRSKGDALVDEENLQALEFRPDLRGDASDDAVDIPVEGAEAQSEGEHRSIYTPGNERSRGDFEHRNFGNCESLQDCSYGGQFKASRV